MNSDEPYRPISVRKSVRDRVRSLKRGGESYTELITRMADQYDPDADDSSEARS